MGIFKGQVAVLTGGSRGIGKAIAIKLGKEGAALCLIGRDLETLRETARQSGAPARLYRTDLSVAHEVEDLVDRLNEELEGVDILVHSAACYTNVDFIEATVEEFDELYAVNVRVPFRLTQALLPALIKAEGQVVFINSSVVRKPAPKVSHYAATKHALRSLADSLREEVNQKGVKVISIYPGRTVGTIQERLFKLEERTYKPERLTQPEDIADTVYHALIQPRTTEVTDIFTRPFRKIIAYAPFVYPFLDLAGIF